MHGKSGTETPYHSLYDINGIKDIDGKEVNFAELRDQVILVTNVASK